jgi:hypothetical protein
MKTRDEIAEMQTSVYIGWLKVDSTPLLQKMQQRINEWIDCYTGFLMDNLARQSQNIDNFIAEVTDGIKVLPKNADNSQERELLMRVMTHLRDVKRIKDKTQEEIEPMR